ncbi:hypothetical protein MKW92_009552 [Papaver armeniacum]|nr:hypothetical protein MKW92_009552 [Papaver armeniacum]
MSHNNLTGFIPSCLSKLQTLSDLDLSGNNLQGTIPHLVFANIANLVSLNLSNNNFDGPLPLPPLNLSSIDLSQNKFSGEISTEIGRRLSNARVVFLPSNELVGSIPFSLCTKRIYSSSFPGPATLDLSNNHLSGTVPSSIGDCRSFISLQLSNNNLTGNVPNELQQIEDLRYLQLNDNNLNGSFPNCIQMIRWLEVLNLGSNNFEGTIPSFLGLMDGLTIISLRSNKFNGSIPEKITELNNPRILDLSLNNLSGSVPRRIGNLKMLITRPSETFSLGYDGDIKLLMVIKGIVTKLEHLYSYSSGLDLSCNILDGVIPEEIAQLKGLSMLNLSHNHLSGVIPKKVGNMTGLGSLDLSFNKLSGEIPKSLTSIDSLGYLNLSYNRLSGKIPRGDHFDTLSVDCSAFDGNYLYPYRDICNFLGRIVIILILTKTTRENAPGDANKVEENDQEDAKEMLLFYAMVALGFVVGFWGLFFFLLLRKKKWWFQYWRFVDSVAIRIVRFFQRN